MSAPFSVTERSTNDDVVPTEPCTCPSRILSLVGLRTACIVIALLGLTFMICVETDQAWIRQLWGPDQPAGLSLGGLVLLLTGIVTAPHVHNEGAFVRCATHDVTNLTDLPAKAEEVHHNHGRLGLHICDVCRDVWPCATACATMPDDETPTARC